MKANAHTIIFLCLALLGGCAEDPVELVESQPVDDSTWETIQERILTPKCAEACHVAGSAHAAQSDLILTPDFSYAQLIGQLPRNEAARSDGLVRVSTAGLTGPLRSYLWEKINWPAEAHFSDDHPDYGNLMPLGGPSLSYGELRFIWRWIQEGAPREGQVVDENELRDTRVYEPGPFLGLSPPEHGFHIRFGPFDVPAGREREIFEYRTLNFPDNDFVKRYEVAMRQGSHHFLAHNFAPDTPPQLIPEVGVVRDLYTEDGERVATTLYPMLYHEFFVGTQTALADYEFPPGIGLRLPSSDAIDLNSHYVNRGPDSITGEVHLNLHTVDRSQIQHAAERMSLNNRALVLPPREITTVERTFFMEERRHVFLLLSHAHEHLISFEVERVGGASAGEILYYASDWQHPPILEFDPPLVLEAGSGLMLRAIYDNWSDRTLGFGLLSEDEMMILFGYYYTD
jgi:hypothetical protein